MLFEGFLLGGSGLGFRRPCTTQCHLNRLLFSHSRLPIPKRVEVSRALDVCAHHPCAKASQMISEAHAGMCAKQAAREQRARASALEVMRRTIGPPVPPPQCKEGEGEGAGEFSTSSMGPQVWGLRASRTRKSTFILAQTARTSPTPTPRRPGGAGSRASGPHGQWDLSWLLGGSWYL